MGVLSAAMDYDAMAMDAEDIGPRVTVREVITTAFESAAFSETNSISDALL